MVIAAQNSNKSISNYKTWQICISNVVYCSLADAPVCVDNIKKHADATRLFKSESLATTV